MREYDHKRIEKKWQKEWERKSIYCAKTNSKKPKFYGLIEFPYPSGAGMHVGHIRSNTAMDIISRKRRMEGYNVLYPIGWDAFGLPTENYAIKTGIHPIKVTKDNTDTFRKQLKSLGFSFDWSREINTTDPKYYKWTQWIFLQLFKKGLAYKKKMEINWCPSCKIGLANEEVVDGSCERCGTAVEKREKEQWMLAITKYADRLDKDLDTVDYLPKIKIQQRNWIGRSEGAEIEFKIKCDPSLALPKGKGEIPGYHTTDPVSFKLLQEKAVEMRKNPTEAEKKLWQELKGNKNNYHFRQQHTINKFIVDFVCLSKNLIIEVDGDIHDLQKEKDEERTGILQTLGYEIIRFRNEEILENVRNVVNQIVNKLQQMNEVKVLPFGEDLGGVELGSVKIFTTRADTIYSAFAVILAPEHELVQKLKYRITNWDEVERYISEAKGKTDLERVAEEKDKSGVELKGLKAINPINNEEIPVWIADFVLVKYGTGAVFADMHDTRDFLFAKKYGLPMRQSVMPFFEDKIHPWVKGKKIVERKAIHAVIRKKNGDILLLYWKGKQWKGREPVTFLIGGVESNEDLVEAAKREIKEETGFYNLKFVEQLPISAQSRFFAAHKDVNRIANVTCLVFDLIDEERIEINEHEKELHDWKFVPISKAAEDLNIEDDKLFYSYLNNPSAFIGEGILVNSGPYNGMFSAEARGKIIKAVKGKKITNYKLRDWVFSRQRYWGEPIPLISCDVCGWVPVPEKDLPVELPKVKNYQPADSGESPLANIEKWVNVKCPKCKGAAKRETDTMPNWAGSSWYYLRYADPKNKKEFASRKSLEYWVGPTPSQPPPKGEALNSSLSFGEGRGGVNWYNGGMEHTTLHLLYSRFWHKFLFDLKLVPTSEPYMKRTSHGLILADDGTKFSKSKGNGIDPQDIVKIYGADSLRLYEMFMGPFDQSVSWNTDGMVGPRRFLEKVWRIGIQLLPLTKGEVGRGSENLSPLPRGRFERGSDPSSVLPLSRGGGNALQKLLHKTIKKVSEDIEAMRFNTAISSMMILATEMEKNLPPTPSEGRGALSFGEGWGGVVENYKLFLQILSPFAPHIAEELWQRTVLKEVSPRTVLKKSINLSSWPKWNEDLIKDEEIKIAVQINGKVRAEILIQAGETEEDVKQKALADTNILKYIQGKDAKRIVYVKNRLINIVV